MHTISERARNRMIFYTNFVGSLCSDINTNTCLILDPDLIHSAGANDIEATNVRCFFFRIIYGNTLDTINLGANIRYRNRSISFP